MLFQFDDFKLIILIMYSRFVTKALNYHIQQMCNLKPKNAL